MEREITVGTFCGPPFTAKIIIDRNGMRVEKKNPSYESDSFFIRSFLNQCLDMDSWKFTWHMDTSKAHVLGSEERKKARSILLGKITEREADIQTLRDAINVLGKWHY